MLFGGRLVLSVVRRGGTALAVCATALIALSSCATRSSILDDRGRFIPLPKTTSTAFCLQQTAPVEPKHTAHDFSTVRRAPAAYAEVCPRFTRGVTGDFAVYFLHPEEALIRSCFTNQSAGDYRLTAIPDDASGNPVAVRKSWSRLFRGGDTDSVCAKPITVKLGDGDRPGQGISAVSFVQTVPSASGLGPPTSREIAKFESVWATKQAYETPYWLSDLVADSHTIAADLRKAAARQQPWLEGRAHELAAAS